MIIIIPTYILLLNAPRLLIYHYLVDWNHTPVNFYFFIY